MSGSIKLETLFNILDWALFLGLCIAAIIFSTGVWEHFTSQKKSFSQYEQTITDQPTVTICFGHRFFKFLSPTLEYKKNFVITYEKSDEIMVLNEGDQMTSKNETINFGKETLFSNKRFALNEMFQQNASKFTIFYV